MTPFLDPFFDPFIFVLTGYRLYVERQKDIAAEEGISTENKQKVTVRIMNLKTGESYISRLAITGNHQIYLPTEIQKMLKDSGTVRIQILGG